MTGALTPEEKCRAIWCLLEKASYQLKNHGGEPEHDDKKLFFAEAYINQAQTLVSELRNEVPQC